MAVVVIAFVEETVALDFVEPGCVVGALSAAVFVEFVEPVGLEPGAEVVGG